MLRVCSSFLTTRPEIVSLEEVFIGTPFQIDLSNAKWNSIEETLLALKILASASLCRRSYALSSSSHNHSVRAGRKLASYHRCLIHNSSTQVSRRPSEELSRVCLCKQRTLVGDSQWRLSFARITTDANDKCYQLPPLSVLLYGRACRDVSSCGDQWWDFCISVW